MRNGVPVDSWRCDADMEIGRQSPIQSSVGTLSTREDVRVKGKACA